MPESVQLSKIKTMKKTLEKNVEKIEEQDNALRCQANALSEKDQILEK